MKKLLCAISCFALMMATALPVYAKPAEPPPESGGGSGITVTYETDTSAPEIDEGEVVVVGRNGSAPGQAVPGVIPFDARIEMFGEVPYITKMYELEAGADISGLLAGFEQDGYTFSYHEVYAQEQVGSAESREVTQGGSTEVKKKSTEELLGLVEQEIDYSENGFTGTLKLDTSSIRFEEAGYSSYSYPITETREYNNLASNDSSYIDKTITKDGVTLEISDIQWEVVAQSPTNDGFVPSLYKGIATYTGKGSGSRVSGYTATYTYRGTVEKTTPGKSIYSVVFRGEPIPPPVDPAPADTEEKGDNGIGRLVVTGLIAIVIIDLGLFVYFFFVKKRRNPDPEIEEAYADYDPVDNPIDEAVEDDREGNFHRETSYQSKGFFDD